MTATVRKFDSKHFKVEKIYEVKNLGWLLRHKHFVTSLELMGKYDHEEACLVAHLVIPDGSIRGRYYSYQTYFANFDVMHRFVMRRAAWKCTQTFIR